MPIRIGTGERGGTFYTQGLAIQAALERIPRFPTIEVVESRTGVSIENASRLDAGDIDFGFISAPWVASARQGMRPFDRPIDLRVAAPMNLGPNFFVARADSGLRKVPDLRGKTVAVGVKGGGMAEHAEAVFAALGIDADGLNRIYVDFAEGAEMLACGEVDAALKSIPLDRPIVMRKGAFRGHDEDLPQLGVLNLLVTHARVDADTVRDVVSAIIFTKTELGQLHPLFAGLAELFAMLQNPGGTTLEFGGAELHRGAVRAYRESGLLR